MPKVSNEETDSPKKRAPRKRAVRRTISAGEAPVRRVRTSTVSAPVAVRKAPTRIEYSEKKNPSRKTPVFVFGALLIVFGGAAWLGFSDEGQIDVNAKINERNQKVANEATENYNSNTGENTPQTIVVPVQNSSPSVPNGGFRGRGVGTSDIVSNPPVVEEVASSTEATTTDEATEIVTEEADTLENSSDETSDINTENQVPELVQ